MRKFRIFIDGVQHKIVCKLDHYAFYPQCGIVCIIDLIASHVMRQIAAQKNHISGQEAFHTVGDEAFPVAFADVDDLKLAVKMPGIREMLIVVEPGNDRVLLINRKLFMYDTAFHDLFCFYGVVYGGNLHSGRKDRTIYLRKSADTKSKFAVGG
jgi:hypothetical protein